jgi:LysR family glycine cleavage system transcriptional activator
VQPFDLVQRCELAYYLLHRKAAGPSAAVVAFKEWLLEESGAL